MALDSPEGLVAGIFISWGSVDRGVVDKVVRRLRGLGLDPPEGSDLPRVIEYTHDMSAGDDIAGEVMDWINQSSIAVLCLSDETLKRQWIITEAAWCAAAKKNGSLRYVVPVQVGALDRKSLTPIAHLVPPSTQFIADVSGGAEEELRKLSEDIFEKLEKERPKILPIAVISMDTGEAQDLFNRWGDMVARGDEGPLWQICAAVGMQGPPAVFTALRERYGARPQDMMPFGGETLEEIVQTSIETGNRWRRERPVLARWIHGELTSPNNDIRNAARALWRAYEPLLLVDSLSMFSSKVRERLQLVQLDAPRNLMVCLPPYTRSTGPVEAPLTALMNSITYAQIEPFFQKWAQPSASSTVAFDVSTKPALRSVIFQKLMTLPQEDPPNEDRVGAMGSSQFKGSPGAVMTGQ